MGARKSYSKFGVVHSSRALPAPEETAFRATEVPHAAEGETWRGIKPKARTPCQQQQNLSCAGRKGALRLIAVVLVRPWLQ